MISYASKGLAGTALGFGIGGTALGLANSGGLLSGLFGGNRNNVVAGGGCCMSFVTQQQFNDVICCQNALASKDAELAQARSEVEMHKANEVVNQKISDTYVSLIGTINDRTEKLQEQIRKNEDRIARTEVNVQRVTDGLDRVFDTLNAKIDCCCKEMNSAIALEAERRQCCCKELKSDICQEAERRSCADNTIVTYVNSTFQPNIVVRETATGATLGAETTPETTFNPLRNNHVCCCGNN